MRWPARLRTDEGGFTLVELVIGIAITGLLTIAISSALFVALRTTDITNQRMAESHDVQIASAYLANDIQSACGGPTCVVAPNAPTDCSGAFTTLITLTYSTSGNPTAVYKCGMAANGQTQVTRTFNNGTPIVIAHFAGTARPSVTVTYAPSQPTVPVSATITLTKASDCTLDCTYTLYGSRRSFNPSTGVGGTPPGDIVVLSTGAASPLTVQGKCDDPGTSLSTACTVDPTITALPVSDVQYGGTSWPHPPEIWPILADNNPGTSVANNGPGEAQVNLSLVNPPDASFTPFIELHAAKVTGSSPKITFTVYDGSASPPKCVTKPISGAGNYDCPVSGIATSAYSSNLRLGFKVSSGDVVAVDGIAFDTASPQGLLTIKGPLLVDSTAAGAVHLFGAKSGSPQLSITNNGGFGMLATNNTLTNGGTCSGCNHNTVTCANCTWAGQNPVSWYYPSIPDPLRSLPVPAKGQSMTCVDGGTCQPGDYKAQLSLTKPTHLAPGIYYLEQGMSASGTAALTCTTTCTGGVMIYVDAPGSVSFTGSSSVNLPALNSKVFANGLYDGIVMFQARSNSSPVKIAGTSGPNALDGIVYVPKSTQVTLATGNSTFSAKAIVAQQIKVSSPVTIG